MQRREEGGGVSRVSTPEQKDQSTVREAGKRKRIEEIQRRDVREGQEIRRKRLRREDYTQDQQKDQRIGRGQSLYGAQQGGKESELYRQDLSNHRRPYQRENYGRTESYGGVYSEFNTTSRSNQERRSNGQPRRISGQIKSEVRDSELLLPVSSETGRSQHGRQTNREWNYFSLPNIPNGKCPICERTDGLDCVCHKLSERSEKKETEEPMDSGLIKQKSTGVDISGLSQSLENLSKEKTIDRVRERHGRLVSIYAAADGSIRQSSEGRTSYTRAEINNGLEIDLPPLPPDISTAEDGFADRVDGLETKTIENYNPDPFSVEDDSGYTLKEKMAFEQLVGVKFENSFIIQSTLNK